MLRIPAILSTVLLLACSAQAIDFTPKYMIESVDGVVMRRAYFADGKVNYGIKLYGDTNLTAGNGGAYFEFVKFLQAGMTFRQSPLTPDIPFDARHLPLYAAAAKQLLPQGSAGILILGEEDNVYPINNWICHRYTMSYKFYGYLMRDTVTFLDLNDKEQFVIQVSSHDSDFQTIVGHSWDIIRSWHLIEPDLEKPYN